MTAQTLDEQNDASTKYTAADVLDDDGYPIGSEGGTKAVNAGDSDADWSFEPTNVLDTSLTGQMTLVLKKGTFDFRGSTVRCPVKIASSSAKLLGGTFTDIVCNTSGSYECINGVFLKRPEKDVAGGNVTGALRCVEMYTDSVIGDLSYTVNGEPLDGKRFYYTSYNSSDDYKQEITLTCSGEGTNLIKSWKTAEYGFQSIISRGRSLTRAPFGYGHTCTISVSSNDITQLHITVSGSVSTYNYLDLTAQTTADPDAAYKATVPFAKLYDKPATDPDRQPLTDTSKVKPGTKVYIEYDEGAAKEQYGEDFIFNGWKLTSSTPLGDDFNITDESGWFTMPDDDVTLELIVPTPAEPGGTDPGTPPDLPGEAVDDGVGTAVIATMTTAAVGAVGYAAVTQIWLESVFGYVPANRQQLALALWEKADKPQPQNSTLYSDISAEDADAQAAARWCTEQGLMKDFDEDFKPGRYVFRVQAIKAWNDLQAQLNADK